MARRMAVGIDQNRLSLLLAVLEKRAGLHLVTDDVFVNIAGGMSIDEPAVDLGDRRRGGVEPANRPDRAGHGGVRRGRPGRGSARRRAGQAPHPRGRADGIHAHRPARRRTWTPSEETGQGRTGRRALASARRSTLLPRSERFDRACRVHTARAVIRCQYRRGLFIWPGSYSRGSLFVGAVAYSAFMLRPLGADPLDQRRCSGSAWRVLSVGVRMAAAQHRRHAPARRAASAAPSACCWPRASARRCSGSITAISASRSCTASSCCCFPYLGLVIGGRKGEWLEPARLIDAVPRRRPASATTRFSTPR